jgi:folate-binding protein YgfZ
MHTLLKERTVVRLSGADRFKFLQGLISNDINKLNTQQAIYACMLTPQGKYFSDFFLTKEQDSILFDLPSARQTDILKKLNIYKLRSDVELSLCPEYIVAYLPEENITLKKSIVFLDPRSPALRLRGFIHKTDLTALIDPSPDAYDLIRINNFIAEGEKDLIPEISFPLEYGIDQLHGIDYNKGCYIGQELIARTHYRGNIRKEIVQIEGLDKLPELGTIIYANDANKTKLGLVCSSVHNKGLALIRSEDVVNLNTNIAITANEMIIKLKFKEQ